MSVENRVIWREIVQRHLEETTETSNVITVNNTDILQEIVRTRELKEIKEENTVVIKEDKEEITVIKVELDVTIVKNSVISQEIAMIKNKKEENVINVEERVISQENALLRNNIEF